MEQLTFPTAGPPEPAPGWGEGQDRVTGLDISMTAIELFLLLKMSQGLSLPEIDEE